MRSRLGGVVRLIGFVALTVAAVLAFRAPQPEAATEPGSQAASVYVPSSQNSAVQSARSRAAANEITAEYAPQQQVVNGWLAADLLEVLADQNEDLMSGTAISTQNQDAIVAGQNELLRAQSTSVATQGDHFQKLTMLVLIGVLAVAWHGATIPLVRPRRDGRGAADSLATLPDPPVGYQPPPTSAPPPYTAP